MSPYRPDIKEKAVVDRTPLPEGRRILAVSDVHGNLPFLRGALKKAGYGSGDVLVLLGDLVEKGPDSLGTLHWIMSLSRRADCRLLCGNCDRMIPAFVASEGSGDERFFLPYLQKRPYSLLCQMGAPYGLGRVETLADLSALREVVRRHYRPELDFITAMPVILDTPDLLFVHGGVPSQEHMEELDAYSCMKNDNFAEQGVSFSKWCVVGHTPTVLYRDDIQSAAPYVLPDQKLVSIDGGCSLKVDGQVNVLIFPDRRARSFTWVGYDGLPEARALGAQAPSAVSFNLRWRDSKVDVLCREGEFTRIRHRRTGYEMDVLTDYLYEKKSGVRCQDATDYLLPVRAGDVLSVVRKTSRGTLAKKDGVTGWYRGALEPLSPRDEHF